MKHMLSSALFAGFAAGLLCALLQFLLVEPDILLAERYESGDIVYFQQGADHAAQPHAQDHEHGPAPQVAPLQRHALTALFAVLTYSGYGLVLLGGIQLAQQVGVRFGLAQGVLWGLAGFLCFQMMPALGLAPVLPGTPSADLTDRQIWWAATASATAVGLWFMAYGTAMWQRVLGVAVLVVPHLWGAPKADGFGGVVPPELAAAFAAHTLGVGLITWLVLGGLVVAFWQSERAA